MELKLALLGLSLCTVVLINDVETRNAESEKLLTLFTRGVSQIVWHRLLLDSKSDSITSAACTNAISAIRDQFEIGGTIPFKYSDASARPTAGFSEGSVSSFGDYDLCLDIKHDDGDLNGKFCMLKYRLDAKQAPKSPISEQLVDRIPPANYYDPYMALCMPSGCTTDDIKSIVKSAMKDYYMTSLNITHCDTRLSLDSRFDYENILFSQKLAAIVLGGWALLVVIATLLSWTGNNSLESFSLFKNWPELFAVDNSQERIQAADSAKIAFSLICVMLHSILCAATPIGAYMLTRLTDIENSVKSMWLQPFFNVAMLTFLAYFSGVVIGWGLVPVARKRSLSYFDIVLQRMLKFMPGLAFLICLEFLWPFLGDGPLYTLEANDVIHDCSLTWWKLLLFIVNWNYILDNCANQTFWFAVDMQLFVLALVSVYLFSKSRRAGLLFCVAMMAIDFVVTGYVSQVYHTSHTAAMHPLDAHKTIEFFDVIHYKTFNYLFGHFAGIVVGEYLASGKAVQFGRGMFFFSFNLAQLCAYSSSAYNVWPELLPTWTIPFYLAITKALIVFSFTLIVLSANSLKSKATSKTSNKPEVNKEEKPTATAFGVTDFFYIIFLALSRLAIPLNLTNYYFIRWDFFQSRIPFETRMFSFFRRFFYSVGFSLMLATVFHLFYMAPAENLRKKFFSKKKQENEGAKKKN